MHISYDSLEIRSLCEGEDVARQNYGASFAQSLQDRIADLDAAPSLVDIVALGLELTAGSIFYFDIDDDYKLAFTPVNKKVQFNADGFVIPESVNQIKILAINQRADTK